MRYYNENPQVIRLKEEIAELKGKLEFAELYNERIVDALNLQSEAIDKFNRLPWHKEMFYKFDI